MDVLELVLRRLERGFGEAIERVLAVGEWAREGIDLRSLPYEEVVIQIVLRGDERPLSLYWQIADQAFAELADEDILVQFTLETLPEWQHAATLARMEGQDDLLGVQLLTRA
ncbi:MAG: hypothetical protein ACRDI2_06410 [Chloroflexota bacterium]